MEGVGIAFSNFRQNRSHAKSSLSQHLLSNTDSFPVVSFRNFVLAFVSVPNVNAVHDVAVFRPLFWTHAQHIGGGERKLFFYICCGIGAGEPLVRLYIPSSLNLPNQESSVTLLVIIKVISNAFLIPSPNNG